MLLAAKMIHHVVISQGATGLFVRMEGVQAGRKNKHSPGPSEELPAARVDPHRVQHAALAIT